MKRSILLLALCSFLRLQAGEERDWISLDGWTNQELVYSHGMKAISADEVDDYEVSVTYALDGGRFGDQLTGYLKALWIAYKYHTPLIYRPFNYSDQLVLSDVHKAVLTEDLVTSFDAKLEYFSFLELDKSARVFEYLNKMPNHRDHKKKQLIWNIGLLTPFIEEHFCEKMDDKGFRILMSQLIKPKKELNLLRLPQGHRTIAIHVRSGHGFDWEMNIRNMPTKFPPHSFYLGCLKQAIERFKDEALYVYIFTDHPDPALIKKEYLKEISTWGASNAITLDCREKGNHHTANVLEDLFSMTQFDCMIHGDSSFSRLAALLSAPLLQFRPSHWAEIRRGDNQEPILDRQGQIIVDPLVVERSAKGEAVIQQKMVPIDHSLLF